VSADWLYSAEVSSRAAGGWAHAGHSYFRAATLVVPGLWPVSGGSVGYDPLCRFAFCPPEPVPPDPNR